MSVLSILLSAARAEHASDGPGRHSRPHAPGSVNFSIASHEPGSSSSLRHAPTPGSGRRPARGHAFTVRGIHGDTASTETPKSYPSHRACRGVLLGPTRDIG